MIAMGYRHLTPEEINSLISKGCSAQSWDSVKVAWGENDYTPYINNAKFSGEVNLGKFDDTTICPSNVEIHSGIENAMVHNVTLGDNCIIKNVKEYIANYTIGNGAYISNVDLIYMEDTSSFGNGVDVSVLDETGSREVVITDQLTSQMAYIVAMYPYNIGRKLNGIAEKYGDAQADTIGKIGNNVKIQGCGIIKGVKIGDNCVIRGAAKLINGTIKSNSHIGHGVIAEDFIICEGSRVEDGSMLSKCFIGQACQIGHGYSASESLFFSNCQAENGEACSIFAGPFTVTHHKSTLLIGGMFSFMNAGSGTNQSNHMYKLGPIHHGILERGTKTASCSHILWPARVGTFSMVMGKIVTHPDTTDMPFSYLIGNEEEVHLVPGVNLRSAGTFRDIEKWPKRDKREGALMDDINFNQFNPYTVGKMFRGKEILENLLNDKIEEYDFQGTKINKSALKKGIEYYKLGITIHLGGVLVHRLENLKKGDDLAQMRQLLAANVTIGNGEWCDLGGLIAPEEIKTSLFEKIENEELSSLEEINAYLHEAHEKYYDFEWAWAYARFKEYFGKAPSEMSSEEIATIVNQWKETVVRIEDMALLDASKDISLADKADYYDHPNYSSFEDGPMMTFEGNKKEKSAIGDDLLSRLPM